MGVIKRQGLKQSIVGYFGVLIGAISTIFIYPLDTATYGLAQFILGTALLISPFMLMGSTSVSIRFFPEFKDDNKGHHGLWIFLHSLALVGLLAVGFLLFIFQTQVETFLADQEILYQQYAFYILPVGILVSLLLLNVSYCANFKRIAIPGVFQIFIKITLPILILLYYYQKISLPTLAIGLVMNYVFAIIGILGYIWWLGELNLRFDFLFLTKDRLKRIRNYGAYGMLAGAGGVLAFRIDTFMVPTLIDFQQNGVYAIAIFIGNAIAIPSTALLAIASPLVAESLQKNDHEHIKDIYQRGSTNLLWIGMLLFCLVVASVNDLFSIMPNANEMDSAFWVVVWIAVSKVIEMATSTNHQIIGYSQYYYYNLYLILILAVLNVLFNLLFIPIYGIIGAALATMLSLSVYNILKVCFIYWKFNIVPFTKASLVICGLGLLSLGVIYGLNSQMEWHPIIRIAIKSLIISSIYFPLAFYLKVSPDINEIMTNVYKKIVG